MHRNDTIIEDAVVDLVEEGHDLPKRLHPQFALWLVRGFLGIVIGAGVLVIRPGFSAGPAAEVQASAPAAAAAATTTPASFGGNEKHIRVAALQTDTHSRPGGSAVQISSLPLAPSLPLATSHPDTRETSRPSASEDLVIELVRPPKIRSRDLANTRLQRPIQRTARSSGFVRRPLTVIARGARRTVRSFGHVVSRLF